MFLIGCVGRCGRFLACIAILSDVVRKQVSRSGSNILIRAKMLRKDVHCKSRIDSRVIYS